MTETNHIALNFFQNLELIKVAFHYYTTTYKHWFFTI